MKLVKIDDFLYQIQDVHGMPYADVVSKSDAEFILKCLRNRDKIKHFLFKNITERN